jgi:ribose transport system ATP-binding protein
MVDEQTILRMEGITKTFPGVKALDDVRLDVGMGEIHALAGENGAGKSTLMKILSGEYSTESGTIFFNGEHVRITSPLMAQEIGISIINQELSLIPYLTVAQNIFLGREPRKKFSRLIDWTKLNKEAEKHLRRLKLDFEPTTQVIDLSIAQQQMVEVAKALSLEAHIIIMDEPTSALTEKETEILFGLIKELSEQGIAIIYISHRMEEIKRLADRVTVFRDGCYIATSTISETTIDEIIHLMVGRKLQESSPNEVTESNQELLRIADLSTSTKLSGIQLSLNKGEILGISGLVGAGRSELARAVFGIDPVDSGEIYIGGYQVKIRSPRDAIKAGIGFVPENRKEQGLLLNMTVSENITINILEELSSFLYLDKKKGLEIAGDYIEKLKVKTPGPLERTINLSGGNQQKIVIAKWLTTHPRIMILDEPTRGIDIGAKNEIYSLIEDLAASGMGIVIISSELPEILRLSNRILVMCQGKIAAELSRHEASQDTIMHYATGGFK